MKNHAFNDDFNKISDISDISSRLNDVEVRGLGGLKDLYGIPLQFGDPVLFLHFPVSTHFRMLEVEFIDVFSRSIKEKASSRHEVILSLLKSFSDLRMLSETNIMRASNEYAIVFAKKNHLIMRQRI